MGEVAHSFAQNIAMILSAFPSVTYFNNNVSKAALIYIFELDASGSVSSDVTQIRSIVFFYLWSLPSLRLVLDRRQ
jgi:hypothetical protein